MWVANNFNSLHILVLSDVARYYKPTKSRNHTGTLFIAYTIETCKHKILMWAADNIATLMCFFYLLQLSIISLGKWEKHLHSARSTENTKENASDMAWLGRQKFSAWDNFLAQLLKNFILR